MTENDTELPHLPHDELPRLPDDGDQKPDTPGHDENGDGVEGGQATVDNHGDILGL